ncbi:MAG TPA: hypothetical protein VN931_00230 [Fibrobacteria bacterium]|nr:hypothetical protein [Fibrobacteria bacterium]
MTVRFRLCTSSLLALAVAGLVSGCNLFNPSGTGTYPQNDANELVDAGQRALQAQNFTDAWLDFSKALLLDSTKSLAYEGLAEAELGKDSFSIANLVKLADSISNSPDASKLGILLGLSDTELTDIYRPLMRVASIYQRLDIRDSLGKTDKVFPRDLIENDLTTLLGNSVYFLLIDANRDTIIESGELAGLKLMSIVASDTSSSSLQLSAQQLIQQGTVDSVTGALADSTKNNINGILTNVSTIAQDTTLLKKLVSSVTGSANNSTGNLASDSTTNAINQNAQTFIQQLGSSTSFYLINDSLDNDGDGCINEEIFGDSLDNDGDSLIDEDGRVGLRQPLVVGAPAMIAPPDGFLHDRFQIIGGQLALVPGNDEASALTWANSTGLLKLYAGLRWVRWDDHSVGNDTIWSRIVAANQCTFANGSTTTCTVSNVGSAVNYLQVRTLGIIEVRKKVLAMPADTSRVRVGKKLVGGCWDNVVLP